MRTAVIIGIASAASLILVFVAFAAFDNHIIAVAKESPEGRLFLANCPDATVQYDSGGLNPIATVNLHHTTFSQLNIPTPSLDLHFAINKLRGAVVSVNLTHSVLNSDIGTGVTSKSWISVLDSHVLPVLQGAKSCDGIAYSIIRSYDNLTAGTANVKAQQTYDRFLKNQPKQLSPEETLYYHDKFAWLLGKDVPQ